MLVVMQEGAPEEQIQSVIDRLVSMGFDVHRSTGVRHTLLGGVGGRTDFDIREMEMVDGVAEVHRITSPYQLASRRFRPEGTVVDLNGVTIGARPVAMIAGPCSVESAEQIEIIAAAVSAE